MSGPQARLLPDGRHLHLQHGPIDVVLEAWGAPAEVAAAYRQAAAAFTGLLDGLVAELPLLRQAIAAGPHPSLSHPCGTGEGANTTGQRLMPPLPSKMGEGGGEGIAQARMPTALGPVARRMVAAVWPYRTRFITPMAAVAGAVADHLLAALCADRSLERAYVNDGGDIAVHLSPGTSLTLGMVAEIERPSLAGSLTLRAADPVRGVATSGQGGRSFSLGIADAVTVLARTAAEADAAATVIGNAVDADHPAIERRPATDLDPDSDLGRRLVTVAVGALPPALVESALAAGAAEAERLRAAGLIVAAGLWLKGRFRAVGPLPTLVEG